MHLLRPNWLAPATVGAAMSTREGGVSSGAYASGNLGVAVGDDAQAVAENRRLWAAATGARPVWLRQVHGTRVLRLTADSPSTPEEPADAAWTDERGIACTVQAADCMPVLFSTLDGSAVAAAHAGWRGLAAGVLEATLQALRQGAGVEPAQVVAWLGPCIGPRQFEVGADVLQAFGQAPDSPDTTLFTPRPRPDGSPRWLAHLQALAQLRLQAAGVQHISAEPACTVEDPSRFFSFRRDRITGRMAAAVWRR
jgi:polyphenol oxidase